MGKILTQNNHIIKSFELSKLDKKGYSKTASAQFGAVLCSAGERLYLDRVRIYSPDAASGTAEATVALHITTSNASSEGGTDSSTLSINTKLAEVHLATAHQREEVELNYIGDAGEDLVVDLDVTAGSPTVEVIVFYKKL